jgi:hypothetical protein
LCLLSAVAFACSVLPAAPPGQPALGPFDPSKPLPEAERLQRLEMVRSAKKPEQVRHFLGAPKRVARQILYHRYFEQWLYLAPFPIRIEFECRPGQEPQVLSVRELTAGPP